MTHSYQRSFGPDLQFMASLLPDTNAGRALAAMVSDAAYYQFPGSAVVVCMVTLHNGTHSVGVAHGPADPSLFDLQEAIGRATKEALTKALPFVVFLHRERAMEAKQAVDLQGRMAIDLSGMSLSDAEVADLVAMMKSLDSKSVIFRPEVSYLGARVDLRSEHPKCFKVGRSVMHRLHPHGVMTVVGWDGIGNVLCDFLSMHGKLQRWFVAGDLLPAVKESEQAPALVPGDVVVNLGGQHNTKKNQLMTVEKFSGGHALCVWFEESAVLRAWFEAKLLEKVELFDFPMPEASKVDRVATDATGASEHYESHKDFPLPDEYKKAAPVRTVNPVGFAEGDVVVCTSPVYPQFNVRMTVQDVNPDGSVRCFFDGSSFYFAGHKDFPAEHLEKVEAVDGAAAPGSSPAMASDAVNGVYTSPHGFTATIGPVRRDDGASGCGMCGGCGCK